MRAEMDAMIAVDKTIAEGRTVRVFTPDDRSVPEELQAIAETEYADEDDRARQPELARVLAEPIVRAVAFPTLEHRDVPSDAVTTKRRSSSRASW